MKKNSEHHTSIQWNDEAVHQCPEFARMDRTPEGRSVREGCPRMVASIDARGARGADPHRRRRRLVRLQTPTMDTHVFDLTVVDVVEETADAH